MIYAPVNAAARRSAGLVAACVALVAVTLGVAGCGPRTLDAPPGNAPGTVYTGPAYLRGTVGSMVSLRPGSARGLLVSNYGVVVYPPGLNNGSSDVPAFLRQRLLTEISKMGVGSPAAIARAPEELKPFLRLSPEQFLDLPTTAVVAVYGLIPPGATPGTRFDVLVEALEQTQTLSLAGGTLWTTQLGVQGVNPQVRYTTPLAEAYGPIYLNPLDDQTPAEERRNFQRQGVVVGGGVATEPRQLDLVLNQPSWQRSRLISDRINERFGRNSDVQPIAQPQTDVLIRLQIPPRWANRPQILLELISHLYVQRSAGFEEHQARVLARVLENDPTQHEAVSYAWRSLGRTVIPVLREYYTSSDLSMRLAALETGAWLGDERASRHLDDLASHEDDQVRARVARALVSLPDSLQGARTLRRLLNDPDPPVRITAYESLATINDRNILDRYPITDGREVKFIIDRVPADRPLVYITQEDVPRVVLFGTDLGFETPMLARLWDNHLMLRAPDPGEPMTIFYQPPGRIEPVTEQVFPHSVAALAYALGHRPHGGDLQSGFDLSYSEVVDAIYQLCRDGQIDAPVELAMSPLAQRISEMQETPEERPETSTSTDSAAAASPARPAAPAEPAAAPAAGSELTSVGSRPETSAR